MEPNNVKYVGTEDEPISVYWNIGNRKIDEFLLFLSIYSGAYGDEFLDKDLFKESCDKFFKTAKKNDKYNKQFGFVLYNGDKECSLFLRNMLFEKWYLLFENEEENIASA